MWGICRSSPRRPPIIELASVPGTSLLRAGRMRRTGAGTRREGVVWDILPLPPHSSIHGTRHAPRRSSRFARRAKKSSLGGKAHASSEMAGHMDVLRELYTSLSYAAPWMVNMEDCESLLSHSSIQE